MWGLSINSEHGRFNGHIFPQETLDSLFSRLAGSTVYTKIDLALAYNQVEVTADSSLVWALTTHQGQYRVNRLPYGLSSAPSIFSRIMYETFHDVRTHVIILFDDILIWGKILKTSVAMSRSCWIV